MKQVRLYFENKNFCIFNNVTDTMLVAYLILVYFLSKSSQDLELLTSSKIKTNVEFSFFEQKSGMNWKSIMPIK